MELIPQEAMEECVVSFCSLCHLGCDNSPSLRLLISKFQINNTCLTGVLREPNENHVSKGLRQCQQTVSVQEIPVDLSLL